MRKRNIFVALVATTVFAACNNDNELMQQEMTGSEVNFFINTDPITRTSVNTSDASTKFVEGDQIGIYATGGAVASNVGYKVGSGADGALTPISEIINWTGEDAGNFYAYYPYASSQPTDKVTFTISNQDTEDNFNNNDFLTARAENIGNKEEIGFKFAHALSLVQVSLSGEKAQNVTEVTITAKPTVEWDYASNTFTPSGTATAIKMWKISSEAQEYWAMVPAQTISSGKILFTITTDGDSYTYTPSSDIVIKTAYSKRFNLLLDGTVTSIATDINTDGWEEDDAVIGGTEVVVTPPIELISEADGTFAADTEIFEQSAKQSCVEGWNTVIGETNGTPNATIQLEESENAVSLLKAAGSWYNSTLYYCTAEGAATASKYTLTFDVKAGEGNEGMQIALMACNDKTTYFVQDNTAQSPVTYPAVTTDWQTLSYTFNLSKVKDSNSSEAVVRDAVAADLSKVLVYFTPKSVNSQMTFYIRNVKLIENK